MNYKSTVVAAIMVLSAASLVYRWLSLYNREDVYAVMFAVILTASLATLLLSLEYRMKKMAEEFQNLKRMISLISEDIESRVERTVQTNLRIIEDRLISLEKRIYR
ncbi:MAG: hypothetical protein NZ895_03940 [Archaeoglobaceae archaeon]|nr:hypothetical protein [Archaeoglobaceae archaeon]MCX8152459.1 hypothetical protein [Archaeoglobaceae archaeon]MDW8013799.1 hypothetical protein [Archaeoglobaceae archaeon]